jgi:putative ABC transport system ATP-binding protein
MKKEQSRVIELSNITKTFNSGRHDQFDALRGINSSLDVNKVTVFKGPSGSGKTTLLSIVGCMARPTTGRIHIEGTEITSLPERFLSEIRRERFGFIFQSYNLIQGISALENTMIPAYPTDTPEKLVKHRAMDLLEKLKVGSKAKEKVEHLSGGEQQRVAIARALVNDPTFVIADEPTAHLDTALAKEIIDIFSELQSEGKTVLVASHDPLLYESTIIDKMVELRDGSVVEET